jgi:hypothetical protein
MTSTLISVAAAGDSYYAVLVVPSTRPDVLALPSKLEQECQICYKTIAGRLLTPTAIFYKPEHRLLCNER